MQIAFAHILFNIITTLLLFPFTNILVKIVTKITPDRDNNLLMPEINLSQLDRNVMEISPATALGIAKEQTIVMGKLAQQSVEKLYEYFTKKDYSARDISVKIEATIDEFDRKLMQFLYSMEHSQLEQNEINVYSRILKTFKDIERISDHCENLVEYFNEFFSSGENIHEEAKEDILSMLTLASEMVKNSINSFEYKNTFLANIVREKEIDMDELNKQARERHVKRIVNNKDSGKKYISVVFVDLISNIERIGDHCVNIADTTLESIKIND
jgi:phosphate:Na+ symporter